MVLVPGKFERIVICVSAGRTGTKALAHHFQAAYPQVYAVHEPKPSYRLRVASNRYVCGRLDRARLAPLLRSARAQTLPCIEQPIYFESNPYLFGFAEVLGEVFDHPQVLHIVRDPREYVRSALNFGSLRGLKGVLARVVPDWLMKPSRHVDAPDPAMSEAELIAWHWRVINQNLDKCADAPNVEYHRIRFDVLFAPDGSGMEWLAKWMGLDVEPSLVEAVRTTRVNASRGTWVPHWSAWDEDTKQAVDRQCHDLMVEYGFEREPENEPEAAPEKNTNEAASS